MIWFLDVRIYRSAKLARWLYGATYCTEQGGGAVAKEGADFLGRFVVRDKVSDVVVTGLEKIEHTCERFGVRVSRLVWQRF